MMQLERCWFLVERIAADDVACYEDRTALHGASTVLDECRAASRLLSARYRCTSGLAQIGTIRPLLIRCEPHMGVFGKLLASTASCGMSSSAVLQDSTAFCETGIRATHCSIRPSQQLPQIRSRSSCLTNAIPPRSSSTTN